MLFDRVVQDGIGRPEENSSRTHHVKEDVVHLPEGETRLDQSLLSVVLRLEDVSVETDHQPLQDPHVLDHAVGLQDGQELGERDEDGRSDRLQVVEDEDDVDHLEKVVGVDEQPDGDGRPEGVPVGPVGVVA